MAPKGVTIRVSVRVVAGIGPFEGIVRVVILLGMIDWEAGIVVVSIDIEGDDACIWLIVEHCHGIT